MVVLVVEDVVLESDAYEGINGPVVMVMIPCIQKYLSFVVVESIKYWMLHAVDDVVMMLLVYFQC